MSDMREQLVQVAMKWIPMVEDAESVVDAILEILSAEQASPEQVERAGLERLRGGSMSDKSAEATYCHCYPVFRCEPATAEVEGPDIWRPVCEKCMEAAFDAGLRVRKLSLSRLAEEA